MSLPIKQAYELVKATQQKMNELLNEPQYVHNLLEINTNFQRIQNRLEFMGGILSPDDKIKESSNALYGPIKSFMGKPIKPGPQKFDRSTTTADEEKLKIIRQKIDQLYSAFDTLTNSIILNSYTLPEDQLVLRGVAKAAGVRDFKTRPINDELLQDIRLGMEIKKEEAQKQAEIDARIKAQDEKKSSGAIDDDDENDLDDENEEASDESDDVDLLDNINGTEASVDGTTQAATESLPVLITQEMVEKDFELKKLKAQPGQYYIVDKKGNKKLYKAPQ